MDDLENEQGGETLYLDVGSLNHSPRTGIWHRTSSSDKENISQPLTSDGQENHEPFGGEVFLESLYAKPIKHQVK